MSLEITFAIFAFLCSVGSAARLHRRDFGAEQKTGLKVKLWTWNSFEEDLQAEADKIFKTDADIVVSCQTEAKVPIRDFVHEDKWQLISYAKHAGFSGGTWNNQYLSIFLRKTLAGGNKVEQPPAKAWKLKQKKANGLLRGSDEAMEWSRVSGVVNVTTRIHQTSNSGKGGASAQMTFAATKRRKPTAIMVLCAHLDAFEDSKRLKGLVQMFSEMRPEMRIKSDVLEAAPCLIFDSNTPECRGTIPILDKDRDRVQLDMWLKSREQYNHKLQAPGRVVDERDFQLLQSADQHLDSVIILGDLNYRLQRQEYLDGQSHDPTSAESLSSKIISPAGRRLLATADPLNPNGDAGAQLIKLVSDSGFAFECNVPFDAYPPTYKMYNGQACRELRRILRNCDTAADSYCTNKAQQLAMQCYMKSTPNKKGASKLSKHIGGRKQRDKKDATWKVAMKGKYDEEHQLGWLDRVCFRSVDGSRVRHRILEEEGFPDPKGSDHMAVAVTLEVVNPFTCEVAELPNAYISSNVGIPVGGKVLLLCNPGYRLDVTSGDIQSSFPVSLSNPPQEIELRCQSDLQLTSIDDGRALHYGDLRCTPYCGPFQIGSDSGPVVVFEGHERKHYEGSVVKFGCESDTALLGSSSATCQADGTYVLPGVHPRCVGVCGLDQLSHLTSDVGLKVVAHRKTGLFNASLYGNEIASLRGKHQDGKAFEGDQFDFDCEAGNALLGSRFATCRDGGYMFPAAPPRCEALCSLHVLLNLTSNSDSRQNPSINMPDAGQSRNSRFNMSLYEDDVAQLRGNNWTGWAIAGDKFQFSCGSDYALLGSGSATCQADGSYSFSGAPPRCEARCQLDDLQQLARDAGAKLLVEKGTFSLDDNLYENEVAQLRGTDLSGWAIEGDEFKFECRRGLTLLGSSSAICQAGGGYALSAAAPRCEVLCPFDDMLRLANDAKATIVPQRATDRFDVSMYDKDLTQLRSKNLTIEGDELGFECEPGYALLGSSSATCHASGVHMLSAAPPRCEVICPLDQLLQFASDVGMKIVDSKIFNVSLYETEVAHLRGKNWSGSALEGDEFKFECESGYALLGSGFAQCQADGGYALRGAPPRCVTVCPFGDAKKVAADAGAKVVSQKDDTSVFNRSSYKDEASQIRTLGEWAFEGDQVMFECEPGYAMFGSSFATCQADGSYALSGAPPRCEMACSSDELQQLASDAGARVRVESDVVLVGDEFEFECKPGHALLGSRIAKCHVDGSYTLQGPAPRCEVVCPLDQLQTLASDAGVKLVTHIEANISKEGLYETDVRRLRGNNLEGIAFERDQFQFGCVEHGCTLLGGESLTCNSPKEFAEHLSKLACKCKADIRLSSISFSHYLKISEVKYVKLSLIPKSTKPPGKSGYISQVKMTLDGKKRYRSRAFDFLMDSQGTEPLVAPWGVLESSFLHVTVCMRRGRRLFMGSRCRVGASTFLPNECPDCRVSQVLKRAHAMQPKVHTVVPLPLRISSAYRSRVESPVVKVFLTLDIDTN